MKMHVLKTLFIYSTLNFNLQIMLPIDLTFCYIYKNKADFVW